MGKSRTQKLSLTKEPSEKDSAETQALPRKYRLLQKYITKVNDKQNTVVKPAKKSSLVQMAQQVDMNQMHLKTNSILRNTTKKHQKRKDYLNAKGKAKPKNGAGSDEEFAKDLVEFGDVVEEPPKITVKPRIRNFQPGDRQAYDDEKQRTAIDIIRRKQNEMNKKKALTGASEDAPAESIVVKKKEPQLARTDNNEKLGRKRKLKDLSESERNSLLSQRAAAIESYRQSKSLKIKKE